MAPEYGATMGFFPVDERTIDYFRGTGRSKAEIEAFEAYFRAQRMFGIPQAGEIDYSQVVTLDLGSVAPSLAGPKRPQDRIELGNVKPQFARAVLEAAGRERLQPARRAARAWRSPRRPGCRLHNGDVLIAAITSCTNTSNPGVLLAAGLLAKKAVEAGLKVQPHIKTSLAPGSRIVTEYLRQGRPAALPRKARLLPGRLRLHHLHRQCRRPDRRDQRGDHRQRPGLRRGAVGQPQFRGPHPSEHQGQLSGQPAAGGRLCDRRHRQPRPDDRAGGHGQAAASRSSSATSGRAATRSTR